MREAYMNSQLTMFHVSRDLNKQLVAVWWHSLIPNGVTYEITICNSFLFSFDVTNSWMKQEISFVFFERMKRTQFSLVNNHLEISFIELYFIQYNSFSVDKTLRMLFNPKLCCHNFSAIFCSPFQFTRSKYFHDVIVW